MITGIGTDIVEIERIACAARNPRFLEKYFTENERNYANGRMESLAGDFAAKEAVAKALGSGFCGFGPRSIEVLRDRSGKPYVRLMGEAEMTAERCGIKNIHVSISHEKQYAIGYAVAERETQGSPGE